MTKIKRFIKAMNESGYKLLTTISKNYPVITFAQMGINNKWVSTIIQINIADLTIHQITPIDGFVSKGNVEWIYKDIEDAKNIAEEEILLKEAKEQAELTRYH